MVSGDATDWLFIEIEFLHTMSLSSGRQLTFWINPQICAVELHLEMVRIGTTQICPEN